MKNQENHYAVMFADFSGSTKLYERFGDDKASQIINHNMATMSEITINNHGTVIKTIGDELMCCFDHANSAVDAAFQIQKTIDAQPDINNFHIAMRIGLHWGSALKTNDSDMFGDAVNVAARITNISRARQIILSKSIYSQLNQPLKSKCRELDLVNVKGKAEPITIYQLIWEENNVTMMQSNSNETTHSDITIGLQLSYQNQKKIISPELNCLMLGRDASCDLIIDIPETSRRHARIEHRRNKFIYIDQSTNGSYISIQREKGIYLRSEELTLWGEGTISMGKTRQTDPDRLIYFSINS